MSNKINIIDVGFAGGLSAPWSTFPNNIGIVLGFEPRTNEVQSKNLIIKSTAIFDIPGKRPFYVYQKGKCSSLFPVVENLHDILPPDYDFTKYNLQEIQEVNCKRLDTIIDKLGITFDFLKVDTEGADLNVIKSMGKYLHNLIGIHTEQHLVEKYQGISLLHDTDKFLRPYGFHRVTTLARTHSPIFNNYLYLKLRDSNIIKFSIIYGMYFFRSILKEAMANAN